MGAGEVMTADNNSEAEVIRLFVEEGYQAIGVAKVLGDESEIKAMEVQDILRNAFTRLQAENTELAKERRLESESANEHSNLCSNLRKKVRTLEQEVSDLKAGLFEACRKHGCVCKSVDDCFYQSSHYRKRLRS